MIRALVLGLVLLLATLRGGVAEDLSGLARFDAGASHLTGGAGGMTLDLALSQPVPWRLRFRADPARLILDAREVDWTGLDALPRPAGTELRAGVFRPGWSRLVLVLPGPMKVATAGMTTEGPARLTVTLVPDTAEAFAKAAARPEPPDWALPEAVVSPAAPKVAGGPMVVVLDPGHGGIDPGAERDGEKEADLVLTFARELQEVLRRDGRFQVVLTRSDDTFVPLETRISLARAAGADLFLSLHADAIAEGEAVGATVYTLSDEATDVASEKLAERHDRDDLLAGVDLSRADDLVAGVLMDMARAETSPRTARLAEALVGAIKAAEIRMHRHPHQRAGFSVLKSPDVPSVLLELGFLSSDRDLKRLTDPVWRGRLAEALRTGLLTWAEAEARLNAGAQGG